MSHSRTQFIAVVLVPALGAGVADAGVFDPDGYWITDGIFDSFWPATDVFAGPEGRLCSVATGSAGELNLVLLPGPAGRG
jgi:hypothetical protein